MFNSYTTHECIIRYCRRDCSSFEQIGISSSLQQKMRRFLRGHLSFHINGLKYLLMMMCWCWLIHPILEITSTNCWRFIKKNNPACYCFQNIFPIANHHCIHTTIFSSYLSRRGITIRLLREWGPKYCIGKSFTLCLALVHLHGAHCVSLVNGGEWKQLVEGCCIQNKQENILPTTSFKGAIQSNRGGNNGKKKNAGVGIGST